MAHSHSHPHSHREPGAGDTGDTAPWRDDLLDQLEFYWEAHLWPRLQGMSDEEFWWEPAGRAWSLRPADDGVLRLEQFEPEPPVPPVTTIAWRLVHIARDVMGARARAIFGPSPAPAGADMFDARHWPDPLPATAAEGLATLEAGYRAWRDGVASLTDAELRTPIGPVGGSFGDDPMSRLVLHINREVMAHGAEICLLRDLFRAHDDRQDPLVRASLDGDVDEVARLAREPGAVERISRSRENLLAEVAGLRHWDVVAALVTAGVDMGPRPAGERGGAGAGSSLVQGSGEGTLPGEPADGAESEPVGGASTSDPADGAGRKPVAATALHFAAAAGELDVVELLLRHGADPRLVDSRFSMPASGWASHFGHEVVADRLDRYRSQT